MLPGLLYLPMISNDLLSVLVFYAYAWSPGPGYGLLRLPMWLPTCGPLRLYLASWTPKPTYGLLHLPSLLSLYL